MQIFFTKSERSVKKHTQAWIFGQVKAVLDTKGTKGICLNKLPYNSGGLHTTKEASDTISVKFEKLYLGRCCPDEGVSHVSFSRSF